MGSAIGTSLDQVASDSNLDMNNVNHMLDDDDVGFDKKAKKFLHARLRGHGRARQRCCAC